MDENVLCRHGWKRLERGNIKIYQRVSGALSSKTARYHPRPYATMVV
jgi:hypothetical protein